MPGESKSWMPIAWPTWNPWPRTRPCPRDFGKSTKTIWTITVSANDGPLTAQYFEPGIDLGQGPLTRIFPQPAVDRELVEIMGHELGNGPMEIVADPPRGRPFMGIGPVQGNGAMPLEGPF